MCGIIGFVDKKNQLSPREQKMIARMMLREIGYRGRDSRGIYNRLSITLGHNRLAIIDTSEKARQPFCNKDNTLIMSYNGEIYNHIDLRKLTRKIKYNSNSDSETFINLYESLKDRAFGLIRGMFAVSFFDLKNEEIILAEDQFGIKPLYYIDTPDWFAWASELKVFKFLPNFSFSLNEDKLFEYGLFRNNIGSETLFKNICKIVPGEFLKYNIKTQCIKKSKYQCDININNRIDELIKSSVSEHVLSDVPVGLQLSGGVDSSLISVFAIQCLKQKNVHSFSIGLNDPKWNEFTYSRKVAKQIKTIHHEILFTQKEFCKLFPIATYHLDEPISYPNTIPMMILAKKARKYVKVLLSGEGADEIFGGYLRYNKIICGGLNLDKLIYSNSFCLPEEVRQVFKLEGKQALVERDIIVKKIKKDTPAYKLCFYDVKTFLPSLLVRQDKMGMALNLENRFPFLDPRLVASAMRLPDEEKFNGFDTKILLKKIASKYFSDDIVYRKKCGFGLPICDWLKDSSGFGKYLNLFKKPKTSRSYLNYDFIDILIKEHFSGAKDRSEILWILISLEVWTRVFIDKENSENLWGSL